MLVSVALKAMASWSCAQLHPHLNYGPSSRGTSENIETIDWNVYVVWRIAKAQPVSTTECRLVMVICSWPTAAVVYSFEGKRNAKDLQDIINTRKKKDFELDFFWNQRFRGIAELTWLETALPAANRKVTAPCRGVTRAVRSTTTLHRERRSSSRFARMDCSTVFLAFCTIVLSLIAGGEATFRSLVFHLKNNGNATIQVDPWGHDSLRVRIALNGTKVRMSRKY